MALHLVKNSQIINAICSPQCLLPACFSVLLLLFCLDELMNKKTVSLQVFISTSTWNQLENGEKTEVLIPKALTNNHPVHRSTDLFVNLTDTTFPSSEKITWSCCHRAELAGTVSAHPTPPYISLVTFLWSLLCISPAFPM